MEKTQWKQDGGLMVLMASELLLIIGFVIVSGNTGQVISSAPAWVNYVLAITGWAGSVIILTGLVVQWFRKEAGLIVILVGLLALVFSSWFVFFIIYAVLAFELWVVSAFFTARRRLWLVILGTVTVVGIAINFALIQSVFVFSSSEQQETVERPSRLLIAMIMTLVFIGVVVSLVARWKLGARYFQGERTIQVLEDRAQLSAMLERNRIAREIHDIIAHSLTIMIVQADGGARAGRKDSQKAIDALETIGAVGRDALQEVRALLSVLDTDTEDRDFGVRPGVGAIADLVSHTRRAGATISFEVIGDEVPVSESVGLSVFRIVQEALTNALKHAGNVPISVQMHWEEPGWLTIIVRNELGDSLVPTPSAKGRGLVGIAERAQLHGGTASSGLQLDGSWQVKVSIPVKEKK